MTVDLSERIEMAESGAEPTLDELFGALEQMPVPEGYRVEIVEGAIYMSPQRKAHWEIILAVVDALRPPYTRSQITSDVRFDFPGRLNGFCPDVAALAKHAEPDDKGRWRPQDVEFIAEVISKDTAANDYGPKKAVYARTGIPVYVVLDPYTARVHVHTHPRGGEYGRELSVSFGEKVDLTDTPAGFVLATADLPREEA